MTVPPVNIHERDTSRAYALLNARFAELAADTAALKARGAIVATGQMTCSASATSTNVTATALTTGDDVFLAPATASAAAEAAYVSAVAPGGFTVSHSNAVSTTRAFDWIAVRMP